MELKEEGKITTEEIIQESIKFFELNKKLFSESIKNGKEFIIVDFIELAEFNPKIADVLIEYPEKIIQDMEIALSNINWASNQRIRLINLTNTQEIPIADIRSKHLGKLIKIKGIIKKASEVRPKTTMVRFECPSCGSVISVLQIDKDFREPKQCSCGRRGGFKELAKDLVDFQSLLIEELPDKISGGQPKKIKSYITNDLVSPENCLKTIPGSEVEIIGVLKEVPKINRGGKKSTEYDLALEGNNLLSLDEESQEIHITEQEEEKIKEISKSPRVLSTIISSIAPSIKGHEDIKKVLALQLFGGVRTKKPDGTFRRGDIHFLIVSDPSLGKSVMLGFMQQVSPKSRLVSGKSTSKAGLIGGVSKDELTGSWGVEAGAMALASGGGLAIDEFEKMSEEDRSSMHRAMEQQDITISKIAIQATLRTQTFVLAAANPKSGRFNPELDLGKQINMVPSLLSRFDVIHVLRDIPNEEKDSKIADTILFGNEIEIETIDPKLLKKYIKYSRQNFHPVLTKEANEEIKKFYLKMRKINGNSKDNSLAISTRQLEGLVRLTQAHAKIRLSNKATSLDAKVAIEIMYDYLKRMGYDNETKRFDMDKLVGQSSSKRNKLEGLLIKIREIKDEIGRAFPISLLKEKLPEIPSNEIDEILEELKKKGEIFCPTRELVSPLN